MVPAIRRRLVQIPRLGYLKLKILFIALRATFFGAAFVLLWGWVALLLRDRYDAEIAFELPPWILAVGVSLVIAGGSVVLACVVTFVARGEGTPAPFDPPRKFVAAGPYRFVRNPMYIGAFLVLLGFGFYQRSPAIVLFTVPWLTLAHLFVVLFEEPHLTATFGETYSAYRRRVRRWAPRLGVR
jgi:protein-S-isoprenylcysteine O-methyltransferase Ste14